MDRQEKQLVINTVKQNFENSQASFIIGIQGMTVGALQGLRKGLRTKGAKIEVAKNTLLKIATKDLPEAEELAPYFKNQVAVVFSHDEAPATAKMLFDTSKENDKLKIIAGSLDSKVLSKAEIEHLALLPSREVLLGQLIGVLMSPAMQLINILEQPSASLAFVLGQAAKKKE